MRFPLLGVLTCLASSLVAAQDINTPVRAGTPGVSHPQLRNAPRPSYPSIAQSAAISGNVVIEAVIDATGALSEATIVRSIPLLDQAAIGTVRQWRFEPPRVNGRAARLVTTVTIQFRLYRASAPLPVGVDGVLGPGMPADFAVVYSTGCTPGTKPGHVVILSPAPIVATLTTATHALEPVYRALSGAGLFTRSDGLLVWEEPRGDQATVSNNGVLMTVTETLPFACSDQLGSSQYALSVRSGGMWRRLWPPIDLRNATPAREEELAPARALIQRVVAGN